MKRGGNPQNLKRTAGPGRPKGSKDKIPKTFKTSLYAIFHELQDTQPELFINAIRSGLEAKAPINFQYLQLWAHYTEGKPVERVEHAGEVTMPSQVIIELHRPE